MSSENESATTTSTSSEQSATPVITPEEGKKLALEKIEQAVKNYVAKKRTIGVFDLKALNLEEIPEEIVGITERLRGLNLRDNHLTKFNVLTSFGNKLGEISLCNNNLTEIPSELYQFCVNLEKLNLTENKITSIPEEFCRNLSKLNVLIMDDNNISEIPDALGQHLTSLKQIHFHSNSISKVPQSLKNLKKLESMTFSKNKLDYSFIQDFLFTTSATGELEPSFPELKSVNIYKNNLGKIPDEIAKYSNLELLNVAFCKLTYFNFHAAAKLTKMKKLSVNDNMLTDKSFYDAQGAVADLTQLKNLTEIDIRRNWFIKKPHYFQLEDLKKHFPKLKEIQYSYADQVLDKVFIGSIYTAFHEQHLKHLHVDHIVNCCFGDSNGLEETVEVVACVEDGEEANPAATTTGSSASSGKKDLLNHEGFSYLKIPAIDIPAYPIEKHFEEGADFIHQALEQKNSTGLLIHCLVGKSRSVSILIAYLMKYKNMRLQEAHDLVARSRSCGIGVNPGFMKKLQEYEKTLFGEAEK